MKIDSLRTVLDRWERTPTRIETVVRKECAAAEAKIVVS